MKISMMFVLATVAGCHKTHDVKARVEGSGTCFLDIYTNTVTAGSADVKRISQAPPWDIAFPSGLDELSVDAFSTDTTSCTEVRCQITVDGAVAVTQADAKHPICKWKP